MRMLRFAIASLGCLVFASSAQATTSVTWDDCDAFGCEGATLSLTVEEIAGGFRATYTINTDVNTSGRTGFNQIGFKAVADWDDAELVFATNGTGNWSDVFEAPVNANSECGNTNGNSSKVCIFGFVDISGGGSYTWIVEYEGGHLLDTDSWHLGAQYANGPGPTSGKIISVSGSPPIPEPSAALLFAAGAVVVSARRRRS